MKMQGDDVHRDDSGMQQVPYASSPRAGTSSRVRKDSGLISFRSRLLRSLSDPPARRRRFVLRWGICALIAASVAFIIFGVSTRLFSFQGVGQVVYFLHDNVFLTIRGHIWTSIFPISIIWMSVLCTIFVLALIGALTGFSILRNAQRILLYKLSTMRRGADLLNIWHRFSCNWPMRARFIEETVRSQREAHIRTLKSLRLDGKWPTKTELRRCVTVAVLYSKILHRVTSQPQAVATALLASFDDLLVLREAALNSGDNGKRALDPLVRHVDLLCRGVMQPQDSLPRDPVRGDSFHLQNLAAEIASLLQADHNQLSLTKEASQRRPHVRAVEVRRGVLASHSHFLESNLIGRRPPVTPRSVEFPPQPDCVALSLLLSIEVARQCGDVLLVLAFNEEFERLHFLRDVIDVDPTAVPAELSFAVNCVQAAKRVDIFYHLDRFELEYRDAHIKSRTKQRGLAATVFDTEEWNEVVWRNRGLSFAATAPDGETTP